MNQTDRNFPWCDDFSETSFVSVFHEKQLWDDNEYFKLENYLYDICQKDGKSELISRVVYWRAMRIFSYLMLSIGCHFDVNDNFKLDNLTVEQLYERRERLQLVFEGFFKGEMPDRNVLGY